MTRRPRLKQITITAYEPAFSIIGDPAKKDPRTRQSADHSMAYIVSTLLRKVSGNGTTPHLLLLRSAALS